MEPYIDAHAHMTVGPDDRWHGGSAKTDLGDFGPVIGDACEIPPLWRRGVLYDVPRYRGITALPAGEPVGADELLAIEAATGVSAAAGVNEFLFVALPLAIRGATGSMVDPVAIT